MPHCDSGVLKAGIPIHSVALYSYGPAVFEQWGYWMCVEKNSDRRHGLMYFDIVLCYPKTHYIKEGPPTSLRPLLTLWRAYHGSSCNGW